MQAVILAGGKGTRLQQRLGGLPKPMADLCGKPLLGHQMELIHNHGFSNVVTMLGYRADAIQEYLGDGSSFGIPVRHFVEESPLGSGGSVLAALHDLEDRFAVVYGDTMLNVDLARFWSAHEQSGADATLFLHPNDHPHDSDLVETGEDGYITAFHPYPHDESRFYRNLVNAALYVIEKRALEKIMAVRSFEGVVDFAKHIFPAMLENGQRLKGYVSRDYIKDAGTPERLDRVAADFAKGKIARGSLATQAPAVFLDRDGTINVEVNRVKSPDEFELLPGVAEAIRRLNRQGLPVVVITNQPVIARGDTTPAGLREIHNKMETLLGREGAFVDAIYYCPHHPDKGFDGEVPELKFACDCRKPAPGMLLRAAAEMNLNLAGSWFIGDRSTDLQTAANAGVPHALLVKTGPEQDAGDKAEAMFGALGEAVDYILGAEK